MKIINTFTEGNELHKAGAIIYTSVCINLVKLINFDKIWNRKIYNKTSNVNQILNCISQCCQHMNIRTLIMPLSAPKLFV
jgi:hypothetical protein